jgi:hypothetical protein
MAITYRGERFSGYNKPKRTPGKNKKFAVLAKKGETVRLVRKRIKAGSKEKMRKPGTKGAPTAKAFKQAKKTAKKRTRYA